MKKIKKFGFKYSQITIYLFLLSISFCLIGCGTEYKEPIKVNATIIDKRYVPSHTTVIPMSNGKTTTVIPQYYPAQHNIIVEYNELSLTINDEVLYKKARIGDKVKVNYYVSTDGKYHKIRRN